MTTSTFFAHRSGTTHRPVALHQQQAMPFQMEQQQQQPRTTAQQSASSSTSSTSASSSAAAPSINDNLYSPLSWQHYWTQRRFVHVPCQPTASSVASAATTTNGTTNEVKLDVSNLLLFMHCKSTDARRLADEKECCLSLYCVVFSPFVST